MKNMLRRLRGGAILDAVDQVLHMRRESATALVWIPKAADTRLIVKPSEPIYKDA